MINIDEGKYWDFPWNWMSGCDDELECHQRCWARQMANRQKGRNGYPEKNPFKITLHSNKMGAIKRKKPAVYATFMGDPFHPHVKEIWLKRAMVVVNCAPQDVFIWLTKRPENIKEKLYDSGVLEPGETVDNLIIGVSVERPEYLDRVTALKDAWAGPNLISFEPLLEYMGDLDEYLRPEACIECGGMGENHWRITRDMAIDAGDINLEGTEQSERCGRCGGTGYEDEYFAGIDAVIIGGESGPKAREMPAVFVRSIINQCQAAAAEVPVYFKQWGSHHYQKAVRLLGRDGVNRNARKLDGRTYDGLHPLINAILDGR